ncbi:unnamed protein product [Caenorhabditis sp. 36 PRJEB53466]|nr:unnamed protein product [Caenorhabditis sp. 36 PRJEB53466]
MFDYQFSFSYSLLHDFQPNPKYYTCSNDSYVISVKHPMLGAYYLVSGIILIVLYSICTVAIAKSEFMRTPAYKIMLVLAVYDIFSLLINSIVTGVFGILGSTFCDNRMLFFTLGAFALWTWLGSCLTCIVLAVNRCCDLNPHLKLWIFFDGNRIYVFIVILILYGFYGFLFSKPIIFHSMYMSWFFDPLIGTDPSLYSNYLQATNNIIVSISSVCLYFCICVSVVQKSRIGDPHSAKFTKTQKQLLYVPCLIAIATSDYMGSPAYKTMLVLGFYDISSVFVHSLATGILGFFGIAFCDYPRLIFVLGSVGLGSWMGCCISSIVLALIRICDVSQQIPMRICFEGKRIYAFLFVFWAYGFYAGFLTKPVLFSSRELSWFFDPEVGKSPEMYVSLAHTSNNIIMTVGTVIFYAYLYYLIILLQTVLFCIFHTIAAIIYVYMQFFSTQNYLVLTGQIAWQSSSASVCLVYLILNRTIRNSVIRLVCPRSCAYGNQVSTIASMDSRAQGLTI